jgi:hypothetical protein
VADPSQFGTAALPYAGGLQLSGASLTAGTAVALGQFNDSILDFSGNLVQKQVAVVVGRGTVPDPANPGQTITSGLLAVVDMTIPTTPVVLGMVALPILPTDVVLHDTTALVGTGLNEVLLVSLVDPRNPVNAGSIANPIFGDRLAITTDGILLGSSFDGNRGGLLVAALSVVPVILGVLAGGLATYRAQWIRFLISRNQPVTLAMPVDHGHNTAHSIERWIGQPLFAF